MTYTEFEKILLNTNLDEKTVDEFKFIGKELWNYGNYLGSKLNLTHEEVEDLLQKRTLEMKDQFLKNNSIRTTQSISKFLYTYKESEMDFAIKNQYPHVIKLATALDFICEIIKNQAEGLYNEN